ncbi:MAG: homoserine kinase [Merismopedia sp. SIO2A8]|nr:homoserine kinase [Symploca sp. SIO2B6]NET53093.1 homoserine kinase [Merismopedia sp. SIO2A8]
MAMSTTVRVTVPATTANIGPGFDCLGAALTRYNSITVTPLTNDTLDAAKVTIEVSGLDADKIGTDRDNLAYQSFTKLYDYIGQTPPTIHMAIAVDIPLARGLGSSATAIVGGLLAANGLAGSPLSQDEVMQLAIAIEGHPDNVVPALLGSCQLSTTTEDGQWLVSDIPWHEDIVPVVAIPNFELSTADARQVLPQHYNRADAIFNTAHLGLLVRALSTGNSDWVKAALQDRIHQPYRKTLIHHYETVRTAAIAAGAYGMVISGAGPTLLAPTAPDTAKVVSQAMVNAWQQQGIAAQAQPLSIDSQGARVEITS